MNKKIKEIITKHATENSLNPAFVAAICKTETNFNSDAIRYEPMFKWLNMKLKRPKTISVETERIGQKTSWGMMQIMGVVARELGFAGWFPELSIPDSGIKFGCKHLARLKKQFRIPDNDLASLAAAYNAGSPRKKNGKFKNQGYVDKVLKYTEELQQQFIEKEQEPDRKEVENKEVENAE